MEDWRILDCAVKGKAHEICQDKTFSINGLVNVVALADGLTSNSLSHFGAAAATHAACEELFNYFDEYESSQKTKEDFVDAIQLAVFEKSERNIEKFSQMKCTLLVCAIKGNKAILAHIGDGAILRFGKASSVISGPQKTPNGGSGTYTILDTNAASIIEFFSDEISDCDGYLLTSDGLKGELYFTGNSIPQLSYTIFSEIMNTTEQEWPVAGEELATYLEEEYISVSNESDDCSLGVICRRTPTGFINYDEQNGLDANITWPCTCGNNVPLNEYKCAKCGSELQDIYDSVIVRDKELFFSLLNNSLSLDEPNLSEFAKAATIMNAARFKTVIRQLKEVRSVAHKIEFETIPEIIEPTTTKLFVESFSSDVPSEKIDNTDLILSNETIVNKALEQYPQLLELGIEANLKETDRDSSLSDEENLIARIIINAYCTISIRHIINEKSTISNLYFHPDSVLYRTNESNNKSRYHFCTIAEAQEILLSKQQDRTDNKHFSYSAFKIANLRNNIASNDGLSVICELIRKELSNNTTFTADGELYLNDLSTKNPVLMLTAMYNDINQVSFLEIVYGESCNWIFNVCSEDELTALIADESIVKNCISSFFDEIIAHLYEDKEYE